MNLGYGTGGGWGRGGEGIFWQFLPHIWIYKLLAKSHVLKAIFGHLLLLPNNYTKLFVCMCAMMLQLIAIADQLEV